jgi:hypothetical protein
VDPVVEQLDAALGATCEALFAQQVAGTETVGDGRPRVGEDRAQVMLDETIRSLRLAIVELRTARAARIGRVRVRRPASCRRGLRPEPTISPSRDGRPNRGDAANARSFTAVNDRMGGVPYTRRREMVA